MNSILCVSHNVFLTREQRYDIYEGKQIEVVGVSVPVWFYDKSETSEPAIEVFCKYIIANDDKNQSKGIDVTDDGYKIYMAGEGDNILSTKIIKFFKKKKDYIPCSKLLLDIKDGGAEWINFKVYEISDYINIIHSIEIQKIENLNESLIT